MKVDATRTIYTCEIKREEAIALWKILHPMYMRDDLPKELMGVYDVVGGIKNGVQ